MLDGEDAGAQDARLRRRLLLALTRAGAGARGRALRRPRAALPPVRCRPASALLSTSCRLVDITRRELRGTCVLVRTT